MNHQPYDSFLFSDEILSAEQQQSLSTHLMECEHCNTLAHARADLDEMLSQSPSPQPAPGFSLRWQAHLLAHRQKRQVRKLWLMTICGFGLTSLTVLIIFLLNLLHVNWAYELTQWIARVSLFAAQVRQFTAIIQSLVTTLPIGVPLLLLLWLGATFGICTLVITWFSTVIRLYSPIDERGNQL